LERYRREDFFLLLSNPLQLWRRTGRFSYFYSVYSLRRVTLDQHFDRLLTFLCPDDPDEAGRRYLRLQQKLVGYFQFRGVADPIAAADEALDRASRRLAEGTNVPDIDRFCLGIARFIIKEGWRLNNRESEAFLQFLEQHNHEPDEIDRFSLMKTCFEQLPQNDRQLLTLYCAAPSGRARARYRLKLAEQLNYTVTAMRVRVTRVRRGLDDCVKELSRSHW